MSVAIITSLILLSIKDIYPVREGRANPPRTQNSLNQGLQSERGESNPRVELGKLSFYH